jgi:hypothetical protein
MPIAILLSHIKMKINTLLSAIAWVFFAACSTNTKKETEQNFQVFNPILKDTVYY